VQLEQLSYKYPSFCFSLKGKIMTNIDIAKAYIRAVQTGDQGALGSLLSPEIVWHQPGNNRFSGTHIGIQAIGSLIGAMMEVSAGTFAITGAKRYMANGDWVAVEIEFTAERDGIKLLQPGVDLLRIERGRIVEARLFSSDQDEEDAFWGH
jgi:ketosteroid isomerase-like protein